MTVDEKRLARKDFHDFQFIIEEARRLGGLGPAELMAHYGAHPYEAFYGLQNALGQNVPLSRKGEERFWQIVRRGIRALGPSGRKHDPTKLVDALQQQFLINVISITEDNAHELFRAAVTEAESEFLVLTHFVPCSVVGHRKPPRFHVGPVEFLRTEVFLAESGAALRETLKASPELAWGFDELTQFFSGFSWVATFTVEAADHKVSEARARKIIQFALDLLKLVVGSTRGAGIRQAYDLGKPKRTTTLALAAGKGFHPSWKSTAHEAMLNEDWHRQISSSVLWNFAESVLSLYSATWDDLAEPYERFLDALRWHGEAITDIEPQSRLVKFWIAMERLVCLYDSDRVVPKAAMLSCITRAFSEQLSHCSQLYGKRSSVMHGSASRNDQEFELFAIQTEKLSHDVFSSYIAILRTLQIKDNCTRQGLETEFRAIKERYDSTTRDPASVRKE